LEAGFCTSSLSFCESSPAAVAQPVLLDAVAKTTVKKSGTVLDFYCEFSRVCLMIGVRRSVDLGDFVTAAECLAQSFDRSGVVVSMEERR